MLTDEYVAGFFEGEGCARVYRRGNSLRYYIVIVQNDRTVLDLIRDHFGTGAVHVKGKTAYQFRLGAKGECLEFCARIRPLLKSPDKIRDVEAMIAGECISTHPQCGPRRKKISQE